MINLYNDLDFLNMEAIFSDETENFVIPSEPTSCEPVVIKLRTWENNVDSAFLCVKFLDGQLKKYQMKKINSLDKNFDFYSFTLDKIENKIHYYFEISKTSLIKSGTYYYNKQGVQRCLDEAFNFTIIPNFFSPKWLRGAVIYQIFVDRFYSGNEKNNVVNNEYAYLGKAAKHVEKWNKEVSKEDICNFYGGDLQGIIEKIEYLKSLGVEVIYLNPIFVSPSNHKYDIQDYDYVDPHIGIIVEDGGDPLYFEKFHNKYATMYIKRTTDKANLEASNAFFCKLVEILHENGIKIILDGVFNHCGAFNKWLDHEGFYAGNEYPVGAYRDENSIYHNYFRWYDKDWPNNDCYDSWWGFSNHPKLNYEASPELYEYILNVGRKWVSPPFNADGWRLDVGADLGYSKEFNHKFWRDFRKAVKEANPNAVILAEHYGDPRDWLEGDQWDTIMNYSAFMEPITWFLTGMEKHSEEFRPDLLCNASAFEGAMRYYMSRFSIQSQLIAMNELSNHDHSRFLTRTNMTVGRLHTKGAAAANENVNKNIMFEAVTFQMTWPGAPTIYYGDEVGLCGWTDPDNRRTFPWGSEDLLLLNFHCEIIKLRKRYEVLRTGSFEYLIVEYGILCYGRFNSNEKIVVVLNNNNVVKQLSIPVWKLETKKSGTAKLLISTGNDNFSTKEKEIKFESGYLKISAEPFSSMILEV